MPEAFATIEIPTHILETAQITPDELKLILASQLYNQARLTLDQAAELSATPIGEFMQHPAVQARSSSDQLEQTVARRSQEIDAYDVKLLRKLCHELKGRFGIIFGFTYALIQGRGGSLTQTQAQHVTTIQDQVEDMAGLTTDVIDLVRIGKNEVPIHPEEVDLASVTQQVLTTLAKPEKFEMQIPDDLPAIWADRMRMQQVIDNVIKSLIRSSKGAIIELAASYGDHWVALEITSKGSSLTAETLNILTDRDILKASDLQPTDWALFVSQDLVTRQSGEMRLESLSGSGLKVTLSLPVSKLEIEP
jgi:two-component system sensor histidine kinase ChiS